MGRAAAGPIFTTATPPGTIADFGSDPALARSNAEIETAAVRNCRK
jgi:hypothetical protein